MRAWRTALLHTKADKGELFLSNGSTNPKHYCSPPEKLKPPSHAPRFLHNQLTLSSTLRSFTLAPSRRQHSFCGYANYGFFHFRFNRRMVWGFSARVVQDKRFTKKKRMRGEALNREPRNLNFSFARRYKYNMGKANPYMAICSGKPSMYLAMC